MKVTFAPIAPDDRRQIIDIFNYYIENSFSAYPSEKVPYEFFDVFTNMCKGYPTATAKDEGGNILGFGILRPYSPIPTFFQTAEIGYFLAPEATGKGIGKKLLEHLMAGAKEKGLSTILASISSLNEGSINFHLKNGFVECGRFKGIGQKSGRVFDVVYCQRTL